MTVPSRPTDDVPAPHWIVRAARTAGLSGSAELAIDSMTPATVAWRVAAAELELRQSDLVPAVAKQFHLGVADLPSAESRARRLIPERLARRHGVFPLHENDRVVSIATSDPADMAAEQDIGYASGRRAEFLVASPEEIERAIDAAYAAVQEVTAEAGPVMGRPIDWRSLADDAPPVLLVDDDRMLRALVRAVLEKGDSPCTKPAMAWSRWRCSTGCRELPSWCST